MKRERRDGQRERARILKTIQKKREKRQSILKRVKVSRRKRKRGANARAGAGCGAESGV